jgi:hypothetical protein
VAVLQSAGARQVPPGAMLLSAQCPPSPPPVSLCVPALSRQFSRWAGWMSSAAVSHLRAGSRAERGARTAPYRTTPIKFSLLCACPVPFPLWCVWAAVLL